MGRATRLKPVQDISHKKELEAVKSLVKTKAKHQKKVSELGEVKNYQQEYLSRFQQMEGRSISAVQLQGHHAFLGNLANVVEQQELQVSESTLEVQASERHWGLMRMGKDVVNKVAERYQQQEQKAAFRKEQKNLDELASRQAKLGFLI